MRKRGKRRIEEENTWNGTEEVTNNKTDRKWRRKEHGNGKETKKKKEESKKERKNTCHYQTENWIKGKEKIVKKKL